MPIDGLRGGASNRLVEVVVPVGRLTHFVKAWPGGFTRLGEGPPEGELALAVEKSWPVPSQGHEAPTGDGSRQPGATDATDSVAS